MVSVLSCVAEDGMCKLMDKGLRQEEVQSNFLVRRSSGFRNWAYKMVQKCGRQSELDAQGF